MLHIYMGISRIKTVYSSKFRRDCLEDKLRAAHITPNSLFLELQFKQNDLSGIL